MGFRLLVAASITIAFVAITPPQLALSGQTLSPDEQKIQDRRLKQNGIIVGEPKLYDDALLQQMLNAAQAKLASLQLVDQAQIAAKVGGLTGADQRVNSVAISVQTPSLPQVKTTEKGPTNQTVQKESEGSADGKPSSNKSTDVTTTQAATDVETTRSAFAPPSPTAAQASTTLPTGFSVSASDLLNEQMQLTFEIANLRLLLDGALSDRMFSTTEGIHRVKPRRTIGIPVAIDPDRRFKNAVAIVEVEIESIKPLAAGAKASITALLPQEKTYNVAAIRESNVSIGGGVVTQVVGIGGNWYQGRKTYYIVKDQDTLAQIFQPDEKPDVAGVAWQFRPVLGQEYVRPRQTQTFVQVSLPTAFSAKDYATLVIRAYWCKYDRKQGTIKEMIPGSMNTWASWTLPGFLPSIPLLAFTNRHLEDLGDGEMLVRVPPPLLPGTTLRIGTTILKDGPLFSAAGMTFVAPLSDLATKQVSLIGRDGEETPLEITRQLPADPKPVDEPAPVITSASAIPIDDTTSLVEVVLRQPSPLVPKQILVIGGKVFGYSDAPIQRDGNKLSAVVETELLQENPEVEVTALFAPARYRDSMAIKGASLRSRVERLVAYDETATDKIFLLYGSRLIGATIPIPASAKLTPFGTAVDHDTLATVSIKKGDLTDREHVVLQRPNERPVMVALPPSAPPKKPAPVARERVVVNGDQAVFESDGLADLFDVSFDGKKLDAKVAKDNKSVTITRLAATGATARAGTVTIDFLFGKAGEVKVTGKLEVISARVETITPAK